MTNLGDVIAAQVAAWGDVDLPLERTLFGTTDPDAIAGAVDRFCAHHLGAGVARYRFFDASSGSVHGVELTDGRAVVVKGHRPDADAAYLRATTAVQRALAAGGFPAPTPLVGPIAVHAGHLTAEQLLPQHRPPDAHAPEVRVALAEGLGRFVALAATELDTLRGLVHPLQRLVDGLYPAPHSPRFDFVATAAGAEWIDDLMRDARQRLAAAPPEVEVVAHGDWRIQNVSVRHGHIDAVYDWDSVAVVPERAAVAIAATTFTVDWEDAATRFPTPAETAAFVDAFDAARASRFTMRDRDLVAAEMVAAMSYGARCEHADPLGTRTDQRDRLRALGPGLLADGLDALMP